MKNYDYWKKSQITDISTFCYWLHQKGVGIYVIAWIIGQHGSKQNIALHELECTCTCRRSPLSKDFSSLPKGPVKGPFPNEKYPKIMQYSQNFHSCPRNLIPKWPICRLIISQNSTNSTIPKNTLINPWWHDSKR